MISFDSVTVRYPGAAVDAASGVSLEARAGALTAVVGPNGSGKSTLVRALLGRLPMQAGSISVAGESIAELGRREVARRVAVVTQREELAFPTTVGDYVSLGRYAHRGMFATESPDDRAAIVRASQSAGIEPLRDRSVDELSGGEWQRVRLARALAQDTGAIVLDEPTTFLDIGHEMAVFELLHKLARTGLAVLLVSHQLNLVARFADHIVLLHRGRVAASGAPEQVMRASILERVYEWPLVVTRDPAVGAPALIPLRASRSLRSGPDDHAAGS
jgi:iron complex transport system ATP-binding protein